MVSFVRTPAIARSTPVSRPFGKVARTSTPMLSFQQWAGNRAVAGLQPKLTISQPGDHYEIEADRVADRVMRAPEPQVQRACACGGTCDDCKQEEESFLQRSVAPAATMPAGAPASVATVLTARGEPLDAATRAFMEPHLGADLGAVRIHRDDNAAQSARDIQAVAYTVGHNVVFGHGQYAPHTNAGRRLLAHELVHTIQQNAIPAVEREQQQAIQSRTDQPLIARLSEADCSPDCAAADGSGGPTGDYLLTILADREGPFLTAPLTAKVGHSWIRLTDTTGTDWTYGFWPTEGYNPAHITADVDGCVHHPDTAHQPSATRTYRLTAAQFAAAKAKAISVCTTRPNYNLFGLQCTEFVRQILASAGQAPALGFGLIWESPNALNAWLRGHSLTLGASIPAATSGAARAGFGATAAELTYRYQFYALLGERLRLSLMARGELGKYEQSVSTGLGVDLTANRVFLPRIYLFGGGIAGGLPSGLPGTQSKGGAGVTAGAGAAFDIDQLVTVGVEYNLVKDIVSNDPEVHRLMISAKIPLF
jgi:uncharacterized protein DUF4157